MATAAATLALPASDRAQAAGVDWQQLHEAPCQLVAEIPVRGFSVRDLLLLQAGSVVNSKQFTRKKVALQASGSFIAWVEFDVANGRLGVRITDLG